MGPRAFSACVGAVPAVFFFLTRCAAGSEESGSQLLPRNVCAPLPASVRLIVYNRTPKCGSTTMVQLIKAAAKVQHINVVRSKGYWIGEDELQRVLSSVLQKTSPLQLGKTPAFADAVGAYGLEVQEGGSGWQKSIYHNHVLWPNLTSGGGGGSGGGSLPIPETVYTSFQLMRDPVDRFVSWHYYRLYGPNRPQPQMDASRKHAMDVTGTTYIPDVDEFVAAVSRKQPTQKDGKARCQNGLDHNMQTRQFCGFHPDCATICSDAALHRAMGILKAEYFLVGTLEDFNLTLGLLERLAPSFFRGVASILPLGKTADAVRHRVGVSNMTRGSATTRSILRDYNQQDDKLYRYAQQLLRRRHRTCVAKTV